MKSRNDLVGTYKQIKG